MLCEVCHALHLEVQDFIVDSRTADDERYWERFDLGALEGVHERSRRCSLCRLALSTAGLLEVIGHVGDEYKLASCTLRWEHEGWREEKAERVTTRRCLRLGIGIWPEPPGYNRHHRMILHADDASVLAKPLYLGREIPERIDIDRVREWLQSCRRLHNGRCDPPAAKSANASPSLPPGFRVIDTELMCIVTLPEDCEYLALCYACGGTVPAVKPTRANVKDLARPSALKPYWKALPRIIQNAICLTSSLGHRYDFIDSFCV